MFSTFCSRIWNSFKVSLPKTARTSIWLLKIMLPVSLLVRFLEFYGGLDFLAKWMDPIFQFIGLRGEMSVVFITSIFLPPYAPIAIMTSMAMNMREATILALMCLITHNIFVEGAVTTKTGSSFWGMNCLRIATSFLVAIFLNAVLPIDNTPFAFFGTTEAYHSIGALFSDWVISSSKLSFSVALIIMGLMFLQQLLEEFKLVHLISKPLIPLMKLFGLPASASFLWIVGNTVGLGYGGALMVDLLKEGKLTKDETRMVNYHLSISHSLIEDTILFGTLGVNIFIILSVRIGFALVTVWTKRLLDSLFHSYKHKHTLQTNS